MKKRQTCRETSGLDGKATAHGKRDVFVMYSGTGRQCHCTEGNKEAALLLLNKEAGQLLSIGRVCVAEQSPSYKRVRTCQEHVLHTLSTFAFGLLGDFAIPLNLSLGMRNGVEWGGVFLCHSHSLRYYSPNRAMPKSSIDIHSGSLALQCYSHLKILM